MPDCCSFGVLAIDPQNADTLYAASATGAFKSTDRGANWNQLSSGLPLETPSVSSLVMDPRNPSTLYVATGRGVFRSMDRGASWTPLNSGLPPGSVGTLAIDPQNSSKVYGVGSGGVFAITVTRDMDRSSKDVEK